MKKRSVRIAHHNTSVSLEPEFWEELEILAKRQGLSMGALIGHVDAVRTENLSSALRLYVLRRLKERL